jgi:hypothetical protein
MAGAKPLSLVPEVFDARFLSEAPSGAADSGMDQVRQEL